MNAETILNEETFQKILDIKNDIEQIKEINRIRALAKTEGVLKDFNDILRLKSKKTKKKEIFKKPVEINFEEEFCNVSMNGDKRPKNLQQNIKKMFDHYKITCKYNMVSKDIDVFDNGDEICPSKDNKHNIIEEDLYNLTVLHDFNGLTKDRLSAMMLNFADNGKYSPVRDWINEQYEIYREEEPSELEKLYGTVSSEMEEDFKKLLIRTWLISCVKAAFSDEGIAACGVLVFQGGKQGEGKTKWFKNLVPNALWYKDGVTLDVRNKDDILKVVKYWIVELGEIGSTVKRDVDSLKAWLTQDSDELRRPFARKESRYPRTTIMCGTVNPEEFLLDDTGNRRFWIIPIEKVDYELKEINIGKLWSEVYQLLIDGEKYWLTMEEQEILAMNNHKHDVHDITDSHILSSFRFTTIERYWMTAPDIFRELGKPNNITVAKISRSLRKLGCKLKKSNGNRFFALPIMRNADEHWGKFYKPVEPEEAEIVHKNVEWEEL